MNENPTAVIRGASLGALRSGRYATRAILTLRHPQQIIARVRVSSRPETRANPPVAIVRPSAPKSAYDANEPIMNRSPWAKLISSMMPYTSVYPSAINAQMAPLEIPSLTFVARRDRSPSWRRSLIPKATGIASRSTIRPYLEMASRSTSPERRLRRAVAVAASMSSPHRRGLVEPAPGDVGAILLRTAALDFFPITNRWP